MIYKTKQNKNNHISIKKNAKNKIRFNLFFLKNIKLVHTKIDFIIIKKTR
jgi:hypothetical protein